MAKVDSIEDGKDDDRIDLSQISGPIYKQHPDETDKNYAVFMEYMHLGKERTAKEAWEKFYNEEGDRASPHIYRWKRKYRWDERVSAWDEEVDQETRREYKKEAKDAARRYAETTSCIMEAMQQEIQERFGDRQTAKEQFEGMSPEDLVRTMTQLQSLEDKALGGFMTDKEGPGESYMEILSEVDDDDE